MKACEVAPAAGGVIKVTLLGQTRAKVAPDSRPVAEPRRTYMRTAFLVIFAILALPVDAAPVSREEAVSYCEIAGLAYGAKKDLVGSVAARVAEQAGLIPARSAECAGAWAAAVKIGQRGVLGSTSADYQRWKKMQEFEKDVLDALIKLLPPKN